VTELLDLGLADAFGGVDAGWGFWLAGLALLTQAVDRSREREQGFTSYPPAEWRRFTYDVEQALGLLAAGVDVQNAINAEPDGKTGRRRDTIAELLHARVRGTGSLDDSGDADETGHVVAASAHAGADDGRPERAEAADPVDVGAAQR
jgi:hypothetical protein